MELELPLLFFIYLDLLLNFLSALLDCFDDLNELRVRVSQVSSLASDIIFAALTLLPLFAIHLI